MARKALILVLVLFSFYIFFLLKVTTISQTSSQLRISLERLRFMPTVGDKTGQSYNQLEE